METTYYIDTFLSVTAYSENKRFHDNDEWKLEGEGICILHKNAKVNRVY